MSLIVSYNPHKPHLKPMLAKEWHIGSEKPEIDGTILRITASGQELEHIRSVFKNIPDCMGNFTIWQPPFSQFIWDNIF